MRAARTSSSALPAREGGKHAKRPRERDADRRLRMLAEIIGPLTQSLGANYEIVLHDYRIPDRSWLLSPASYSAPGWQRHVRDRPLHLGRGRQSARPPELLGQGAERPRVNSFTIVLRDERQTVFGALCINMDVTVIRHAAAILDALSGNYVEPEPTTFTNDIRDVIDAALREVLRWPRRGAAVASGTAGCSQGARCSRGLQCEKGNGSRRRRLERVARHGLLVPADGPAFKLRIRSRPLPRLTVA